MITHEVHREAVEVSILWNTSLVKCDNCRTFFSRSIEYFICFILFIDSCYKPVGELEVDIIYKEV